MPNQSTLTSSPPRLEDLPEFLTTDQLAALIQKSKGTLYHWRAANVGPRSFRLSGHVRYQKSDVTDWLAAQVEGV